MFWRRRKGSDFSAEIEAHIQHETERLREQGMSEKEALAAARRSFGNVMHAQEKFYERGHWMWWDHLKQDVGYGLRMLHKSPGFTAVVVLTLALGIGTNTAIFSYVDAWLIKPLPYPQADRLMVFLSHDRKKGWTNNSVTSAADFLDFQRANTSFQQTATWTGWNYNLTGDGGPPAFIEGGKVSWSYFETLGAKPILGRTFTEQDDAPGRRHVAVLGQGLWQGRFASDPGIVGRTIRIDDEQYLVIGVMPGTFQFPLMGIANLWTPLALTEQQSADRNTSWFSGFGRLKPGVSQAKAAAESEALFARLEKEYPTTNVNVTQIVNPIMDAGSDGRRNTCLQFTRRSLES